MMANQKPKAWKWQLVEYGQSHRPRIVAARHGIGKSANRDSLCVVKLHPSQYPDPFTLLDENSCTVHRIWTPSRAVLLEVVRWEADRLPSMTPSGVTWRGTGRCVLAHLRKEIKRLRGSRISEFSANLYRQDLVEFQRYLGLLKKYAG